MRTEGLEDKGTGRQEDRITEGKEDRRTASQVDRGHEDRRTGQVGQFLG